MEPYLEFEQRWSDWAGVSNVVACASGTAALHLALESLQLPLGSAVIVPDFTMVACARAVTLAGLTPVFVDCTPDLLIDVAAVEEAVSETLNVAAIMPVHVYGRRAPMDAIAAIARRHRLAVVEDLAEAHGVRPHPATDAACWSMYRNKIVAGEEGGAVAFKSPSAAALARQLRSLGFTDAHDFMHVPRGHNYRMSNAHASLILDSLAWADENLRRRRLIEVWYDDACPDEWRMPPRDVCWVFDVRLPTSDPYTQAAVVRELHATGVAGARLAFKPMSAQPEYRTCRRFGGGNAAAAARSVVYLPVVPSVTTEAECHRAMGVVWMALCEKM